MKKRILCILFILLLIPAFKVVYAAESDQSEVLGEMVDGIDDGGIQRYVDGLDLNFSVRQTLKDIISGKNTLNFNTFLSLIFDGLNVNLKENAKICFLLLGVLLLSAIVNCLKSDGYGGGDTVYYVIAVACISIIGAKIFDIVTKTNKTIETLIGQTQAVMPIIFSMMAISGAESSVGVYQTVLGVFTQIVGKTVTSVLLPLTTAVLALSLIDKVSSEAKLDGMKKLFCGIFKWLSGIIFSVFSVIITISGISASVYDGIAFKLGKYTVSNAVPIVGGYISSGLEVVVSSAILIKNAIGVVGIFILVYSILNVILDIIVFSMLLQFVGAITQPIVDNRLSSLISSVSDGLKYCVAIICVVGFLYFVLLLLTVSTGNMIV